MMNKKNTRTLAGFRREQARLREEQWVRTILKARRFKGIETLRQGISFSEDLAELRRGMHLEHP